MLIVPIFEGGRGLDIQKKKEKEKGKHAPPIETGQQQSDDDFETFPSLYLAAFRKC